jgi:ribosome-associated toxin RatA of RatAB toxin-antitoxin module
VPLPKNAPAEAGPFTVVHQKVYKTGMIAVRTGVLASLLMLWLSTGAAADPPTIDPPITAAQLQALKPLLESGELSLVQSDSGGRLKQVCVAGLVEAPADIVWEVLTDYAAYTRIFKNLADLKVLKSEPQEAVLAYELEVPGSNLKYRLRHRYLERRAIEITLADQQGDLKTGRWRWDLFPLPGGGETILTYTLYTDVRESSWILRQALKTTPSLEHGLNVATGMVTLQAVKREAEARQVVRR